MTDAYPISPPRRLLLAVGGDHLGQWLPVCIARALPSTECRFIGQLWSDGHFVRAAGLRYRSWPWSWSVPDVEVPSSIPNHTDFHIRNLSISALPAPVRRAYGMLQTLAAQEVDQFQPDAVISLTAELALSHLLDGLARSRGIAAIGLQTTYLRQALLVHADGARWWQVLRDAELSGPYVTESVQMVMPKLKSQSAGHTPRRSWVWAARAERLIRATLGVPSFDSVGDLLTTLTRPHTQRLGGFPDFKTPDIGEQPPSGLALVALHRPVLQVGEPDWTDLLRFALAVTPPDWALVVRPHPDEPERPLPDDLAQALFKRGARVSRPRQGASLDRLLQTARLLITLNSATGLQALLAGVPTVTLAPAFYARPGMAWAADFREPQSVQTLLARGDLPRPNVAAVQAFVRWIEASRSASLPPISDEAVVANAVAERICLLAGGSK